MIVQHNLTAMNSNRMLGITTNQQSKSTEKLSSGYKINRAADDAAGLSISEKMRKQVRGLTQASANAQDGISAVQTAEGALAEVHDMLQRMNELATKAANGTNSEDDRSYIQAEVDQLVKEINRVAETTKFNETYLLKGDAEKGSTTISEASLSVSYKSSEVTLGVDKDEFDTVFTNSCVVFDSKSQKYTVYEDDEAFAKAAADIFEVDDNGDIQIKDGLMIFNVDEDDFTEALDVDGGDVGALFAADQLAMDDLEDVITQEGKLLYDDSGDALTEEDILAMFNEDGTVKDDAKFHLLDEDGDPAEIGIEHLQEYLNIEVKAAETLNADLTLSLHVGADGNDDNKITFEIKSMTAAGIGVNGLDVSSEETATDAIETLKASIKTVSEQRSGLGAIQNRLEHTILNLDNIIENTTAAEAQIRDTNMATEMVKYSNNQILSQAGQAMLAQANQSNQGVLSLL